MNSKKMSGNISFKTIFARSEVTVIVAVVLLAILFAANSSSFFTSYNLFNMGRTSAIYIFIALSQAMVIITGGMNLSLGFIGGMSVVGAGYCMQNLGFASIPAIIVGLLIGVVAGIFNGYIITSLKLNSFVVTLATSFIFTGLILGLSRGFPYNEIPKNFTFIGREGFLGVPLLLWLAILFLIILWYFFKYTVTGRRYLATGGNVEAAKMSGINTDKMIILAHIFSGLFASIAGLLWISRTGSAQPTTGSDWMLISFAVAVIGGTLLKGGIFNPVGMLFAGFLIVMVKNGLVMLNANVYYEQTYLGIILLLAVSLERIKFILDNRKLSRSVKK
jgi:ribose transport system permease protein